MTVFTKIHGSCHCENIRFDLQWPKSEPVVSVRKCGCAFCQKHSGAWTSNRNASLDVQVEDWSQVSKYRFGTKTADFCVCSVCGVVPIVLCELEGRQYAVVSALSFAGDDKISMSETVADFDCEGTDDRLDRRRRNWIPQVTTNESLV